REQEITITCGATEAMAAVLLSTVDPDDEIVVLEPFYENYGPDAVLCAARPVHLPLAAPDFRLDAGELRSRVGPRTRALIVNSPNNPTGRVFTREEMEGVAAVCRDHDLLLVTDEIYEHIVYEGEHICAATLPGMRERTVVISGASKTFSVTGWRVGTIVAPPDITAAVRKVHDFLTVGAPAPLQEGVAVGLEELDHGYYRTLAEEYRERRDVLVRGLVAAGFRCAAPQGAYYVLADHSALSDLDDRAFALKLTREAGVACVPGSSFFADPARGRTLVRFAFCKRLETLEEAARRLAAFGG
ncbi:MAG TPA: aminotransferase class I/II-fold pyridoxal phosphate-dependent enzyme, partial [Longimicrobiales bacterium]|nr:aminotransferase class I/II-fold pyridoxal phosphate-dependent enzyme [Longimicrobiales bacterium]